MKQQSMVLTREGGLRLASKPPEYRGGGWRIECFRSGRLEFDTTWNLPLIDIVGVQAMRLEARQDGKYFVMMTRVRQ